MMEIKELNKKQLILLTLFITFVVSIATGIVTVSLMQQMPESVPQTVNNVIQRTIEKVTTVQVPVPVVETDKEKNKKINESLFIGEGNILISIYLDEQIIKVDENEINQNVWSENNSLDSTEGNDSSINLSKSIGQGVLISDVGLILIDSSILNNTSKYKVVLDEKEFEVSILKKFNNGFTVLKINQKGKIENQDKEENADAVSSNSPNSNIEN